jgi:hypothetical protein
MRSAGHKKPSRLLRPALFDWFEARITQCPARTRPIQLGEVLRTAIRRKNSHMTAPSHTLTNVSDMRDEVSKIAAFEAFEVVSGDSNVV